MRTPPRVLATIGLVVAICWSLSGCGGAPPEPSSPPSRADEPALELLFTYGSEKQNWIEESTKAFNAARRRTTDGTIIRVQAIPMGSGECIDEILAGRRQVHLTSPASAAFIKLGNAESKAKTGRDLVGPTQNLVLSPIVVAMWEPMARAIGFGQKPIGWSDIVAMANRPDGWAGLGHPEWGPFRFGHTHPGASNSGLSALLAEAYAGTGKVAGLTLPDLSRPDSERFVRTVEQSVVHYGSSTGFFGRKMFANGPAYLSAAVLYENMVIEARTQQPPTPLPVVAIYPREGTFWSDHPVGIVERDYVTPAHRQAAEAYIAFLLEKPRQERAMALGFHPADPAVLLVAPIDLAHGVNPKEPQTTLEVPDPVVLNGVLRLWERVKKSTRVVLAVDVSGSMQEQNKIGAARDGAAAFVSALGDVDELALATFNERVTWAVPLGQVGANRKQTLEAVSGLFASGGTALYDAVSESYRSLAERPAPSRITTIVVLSDGADRNSKLSLQDLLAGIRSDNELRTVRVFTIGYGSDASATELKAIADATQARYYEGKPDNIREVFKDISTFF